MARIKNIEAYCNSCGTVQKMEITSSVTGEESEFKKWAKCKSCKQVMIVDISDIIKNASATLEGIENEDCKKYSPSSTFEVGETIYHENWDDFGRVLSKETLSNGKSSISVEFQKSGIKKLIESLNNPASGGINQEARWFSLVGISVGENESIDKALRRFKKKYERSGVLKEYKKRTFFVKPSVKKRMEKIKATRRFQRTDDY